MREGMNPKASGRTGHLSGSIHQASVSVGPYCLAQFSSSQVYAYGGGANGCDGPADFVAPVLAVTLANLLPQVSTKSHLVFRAMDNSKLL